MWFSSLKKMFDILVLFSVLKLFYLVERILKNLFCLTKTEKIKQKNKSVPLKSYLCTENG
jgi:hypothetical protein